MSGIPWCHGECCGNDRGTRAGVVVHDSTAGAIHIGGVLANLQPLVYVERGVDAYGVALVVRTDDGSFLIVVAAAKRVVGLVGAAVNADVVVLHEGAGAEHFVLPVGVDGAVVQTVASIFWIKALGFRVVAHHGREVLAAGCYVGVDIGVEAVVHVVVTLRLRHFGHGELCLKELFALHYIEHLSGCLPAYVAVVADFATAFASTTLGAHEDDTVGTTRTIDGG